MEALRQTFQQYAKLFASMSSSQRGTLIAVPAMIVGAFVLMMWNGTSSSYVALSFGKRFTSEELPIVEQTLKDAGLDEFRTEGQQIMVPAKEVDRYNAAAIISGSSINGWADELSEQIKNESAWATAGKLQIMKEIALRKHLTRMIQAVSDVERANVVWTPANPRENSFRRSTKVTATVWVKPRIGREISPTLVRSLRAAVASSVAGLSPNDVTVFDQSTGRAYTPDKEGEPYDNQLIAYIDEFRRSYQKTIEAALAYIPGVNVAVGIDLENLQSSVEQRTTYDPKNAATRLTVENTRSQDSRQQPSRAEPGVQSNRGREVATSGGVEKSLNMLDKETTTVSDASVTSSRKEYIAAMPKAVTVAVAVPLSFYRKIAEKNGLLPGGTEAEKKQFDDAVERIRSEEELKVKTNVERLIPPGSPENAVSVISVPGVEPDVPQIDVSLFDTLRGLLSQWGGAAGLALLALWVVNLLRKSMPKLPSSPLEEEVRPVAGASESKQEEVEAEPDPVAAERDELQTIVRDDPEMAAAVLGKWLQSAR